MKTRLTQSGRASLSALVRRVVTSPVEAMLERNAYATAAPLVRTLVEARYPPADMAVMKRYDAAFPDSCIQLQLTAGGMVQFNFEDEGPLCPRNRGCTGRVYLADDAVTGAFEGWQRAVEAHHGALMRKHADYYALIQNARHFEDVLAVWPEAEECRSACGAGTVAIGLTEDVLARIRSDVAARSEPSEQFVALEPA
jgi:hypothetical protein